MTISHGVDEDLTMSEIECDLTEIESDLAEIKSELAFIKEMLVRADTTIATIAQQVMPTIEEISKSPLLKMLGMKK